MSMRARVRDSYKVQQARRSAGMMLGYLAAPIRRLLLPLTLRARDDVSIHFGCGDIDDPRFVNVDARPLPHVHVVTRSPMLSAFTEGSVNSIYACHVFEHISFHRQSQVLLRWFVLLRPGGTLRLSVPDFDKLIRIYTLQNCDPKSIQATLMGAQDYVGNFHCAIFTHRHLETLLLGVGFADIQHWHPLELDRWPRDHSWNDSVSLNLVAFKP